MSRKDITHYGITAFIIVVVLAFISCSIPGLPNPSAQQTLAAIAVQQTMGAQQALGEQQVAGDIQATNQALEATRIAQEMQATLFAQQASQQGQVTQEVLATEQPPTGTEPPTSPDLEQKIKSAKILLFEDMSGQMIGGKAYTRYVKEALDGGGYSYTDVGSAMGWLKEQMLSSTDWDLIIIASEYKTRISGEYFQYLLDHINRGTGVILELWYLDAISEGKIAAILSKCGIEEYKDWLGTDYLALWPLVPDHPIFNDPNKGISMRNYANFWPDHGDFVKLTGSGDAVLLLGTQVDDKHGVLTSCMQGRLLIQTFLDHDYMYQDVVPYWQNAVYNTLKNKFLTAP